MADSLALCWQNLNLYVDVKKRSLLKKTSTQRVKLLHKVSGVVRSGSLCAIMGPSGAGKTTLLAAISQRNTGIMSGEIQMNGRHVDKELMLKMSGFVPQQNLAVNTLTVREHMHFMATLKMDRRVSKSQMSRVISSIMQDLGLNKCNYTVLSKLSGGETKRVSLAVELLTDPPILICDEPTSGLDSYTAYTVIALLRTLSAKGKAVICSVHQPASGIFEMFDSVSLLVSGGKLAYFGEVSGAKQYFAEMGLVCPPSYNTADFVLKQLCTIPDKLTDKFLISSTNIKLEKEIESVKRATTKSQLIYGMTAFIISIPYAGTEVNQEGIQSIQGLNYTVITETVFTQAYAVLHTFPQEIPVLLREMGNGVYQPLPYYISKVLVLLPRVIIESTLFALVIYVMAGVDSEHGFFWFCLPVVMSAIASSAYGCCLSAAFENTTFASLLAVPFDLVSYIFSGIFLQLSTVPLYLSWIKYVSRFYYGLEAISILQWKDLKEIPCSDNPDIPCINNGNNVLISYGYQPNNLLFDFGGLIAIFLLMHYIGFLFIARRSKKQSLY